MQGWPHPPLKKCCSSIAPPLTSHLAGLFPAEPSVSREACPPPKLKAWALIWSPRFASTTGLPTAEKRRPSGRSWPWTPSTRSPTASTLCCPTARHITPRTALHLPVRPSLLSWLSVWWWEIFGRIFDSVTLFLKGNKHQHHFPDTIKVLNNNFSTIAPKAA